VADTLYEISLDLCEFYNTFWLIFAMIWMDLKLRKPGPSNIDAFYVW